MRIRGLVVAGVGGLMLLNVGWTGSAAQSFTAALAADAMQSYILGPADVLEVSVLGSPTFTTKGRIDEDGTFRVPFLGAVSAANKTPVQFGDALAKALDAGGYFSHPVVQVEVTSYASRYVTVLGFVARPDLVSVDRAYRLSEIIAKAGGIRDGGSDYVVFRPKGGDERKIPLQAMAAGDVKDDPFVSPGDKVFVPEADVFYVSGQVRTPGAFPMKLDMTFRMAIARAGGQTDSGSDKNVTVTRSGKKMSHVNLDAKVAPGDTLVIPERLF